MLNLKPLPIKPPWVVFKAPREWLPRLRALLDAYPQDDLASTEALCCRIVGDFTAGIVLHRLLYWLPKSIRDDSAIWKSDREWYAELNLSYTQMKRVRARLSPVVKSWLEMAQSAPTYHYQLQVDAFIQGIAAVLNRSDVDVKLVLLEKVENRFSAESRIDSRQNQESITIQDKESDERLKIYHPHQKRFVGFTPLSTQLADQYTRLGESIVREVLKRCDASRGQSWQYVLRALENVSIPARAPIPLYDSQPPVQADDITVTDDMRQAWEASEKGRQYAARVETATNPSPAASMDKHADIWNQTYKQLEVEIDRASFNEWLRGTRFLKFEAGIYHIAVPNTYIRDMLQHHLYREVRRWLVDIAGQSVELRFEVRQPVLDENKISLSRLLDEAEAAKQEFYRKLKGDKWVKPTSAGATTA